MKMRTTISTQKANRSGCYFNANRSRYEWWENGRLVAWIVEEVILRTWVEQGSFKQLNEQLFDGSGIIIPADTPEELGELPRIWADDHEKV